MGTIDQDGSKADLLAQLRRREEVITAQLAEIEACNAQLSRVREALETLNRELETRVEARTAQVHRLLAQKDRFINQLSHDLKSPLVPLTALLPMMHKFVDDAEGREILDVITVSVEQMQSIVLKTLELARLNAERRKLELTVLDLGPLTQKITALLRHVYDEKQCTVVNRITSGMLVDANQVVLTEVFNNLISNAVKYMGGPGAITIDARRDGDWVTVSVADTGIGMTAEQIPHVFEEFYKADQSRTDRNSTGLGLAICRRIVDMHGGRTWVESLGLGKGTTVYFTLRPGGRSAGEIYRGPERRKPSEAPCKSRTSA